jgi:hypothetical protein
MTYPQVLTLSPAADDLLIWDFLRQAPLTLARIQRLLHSLTGLADSPPMR